MEDRSFPQAIDAELVLVASLIYSPDLIQRAYETCPVESFYDSEHARVYGAIIDMWLKGIAVDIVTLAEHIQPDGQTAVIPYIDAATTVNIDNLCRKIVEMHIRRKAIKECDQIQKMAFDNIPVDKIMTMLSALNGRLSDDIEAIGAEAPSHIKILTMADLAEQAEHYFDNGETSLSFHPGWNNLANFYRPAKGTLNIYTGIPSSGKSEFHDALMVNTAIMHGWKWLVFSPENYPYYYHVQKLSEKIMNRGYFSQELRMTKEEFKQAIDFIAEHFAFIDIGEESPSTTNIFRIIKEYASSNSIDGVVIDPWNSLEVPTIGGENKTYAIGRELNRARQIARRKNLCFNIIAHPAKMMKDFKTKKYDVPRPYDIDGSANWFNMASNCLSVHRYYKTDIIAVHVQKIKFKPHGKVGVIFLKYIKTTGRFEEYNGDPEEAEENASQTSMW